MGRIDNTKILYIVTGLIIGFGILFALLLGNKSGHFFHSQPANAVKSSSALRIGRNALAGNVPKSTWRSMGRNKFRVKHFDSGHDAVNTFADPSVAEDDIDHPLVASTKFIKKKKDKNKKKSNVAKRKGKPGSRGALGLEDEDGSLDPLSPSDSTSSHLIAGGTSSGPRKNGAKDPKKDEDEENMNTVEFWEEPIFVNADPSAVFKLVDSYQIKKVSSNVFYTVVTLMTEDGRTEIREFAVVALSATPSVQSFAHLTNLKHADKNTGIRNEAGHQIATYADASRLGYVVGTLKSSDDSQKVTVEALRSLTQSTVKYTELQEQNTNPDRLATDLQRVTPRYEQALDLIEKTYSTSPDAVVQAEATKTAAAITKFITNSTVSMN